MYSELPKTGVIWLMYRSIDSSVVSWMDGKTENNLLNVRMCNLL